MNTIAELISSRANDEQTALLFDEQRWSYREFVEDCAQRAAYLLGARDQSKPFHIAVLLDNVPEYPLWLGACALAGATLVGLNPTRRGADMERDISHTECQLMVTESRHMAALDGLNIDILPSRINDVDSPEYRERLRPHAGSPLPEVQLGEDDIFCLIFTSGTSGHPKACIISQGHAVRRARMLSDAFQLGERDVHYVAMPLFHSNSLFMGFAPPLVHGGAMALRRKFSASGFLPDIRRHGVSFFNYVGKPLAYILATPEKPDDAINPLKIAMGNEAADVDIERFSRRFGCTVVDTYGSTEGGALIMRTPDMPRGALGKAASASTLVMNPDTGQECARAVFDHNGFLLNANEAAGELVDTATANDFEGYWKNEQATDARTRNGYIWMGDLAYRDEQDFFYFVGRDSDRIRVDGENIACAQIEQVLHRHPKVMLAAVYPVPDPIVGDRVMAALQLVNDEEFAVLEFCRFLEQQTDFGTKWMPSFIRLSDALPTTETNKILKRKLRQEYWRCEDPVWYRDSKEGPFRLLGREMAERIEQEFIDRGRASVLGLA